MRLKTVWTLPAMPFRERLSRTAECGIRSLAHHLPRRLAYWSFIDSGVRHIGPREEVPAVRYSDILQRMSLEG